MTVEVNPIEDQVTPSVRGADRKRILVCLGTYLPGYKCGGPIRSVANRIAHLSPYLDFYVVTADRDTGDNESYPGVKPNHWYRVGDARVLYGSSIGAKILRRAFREVQPDVIVLNSFWDTFTRAAVLLRRFGVFGDTPLLLAPRGTFSPGALEIKQAKKLLYLHVTKVLGLYKNVLWQTTAPSEKQELLQAAPVRRLDPDSIYVAYEITDAIASPSHHTAKQQGAVKLAYISRISEKKNLHFLFDVLMDIRGDVQLNLFGPLAESDLPYWAKCRARIAQLPKNISVEYQGGIEHSMVPQVLHDHHFFVLPTRGENFCHAAVESFVNGTPVVLSDQTPWTNLSQAHAGFDIPLTDREAWVTALQRCVDMDQQIYESYLTGVKEFSRKFSVEEAVRQHLAMFQSVLGLHFEAEGRP